MGENEAAMRGWWQLLSAPAFVPKTTIPSLQDDAVVALIHLDIANRGPAFRLRDAERDAEIILKTWRDTREQACQEDPTVDNGELINLVVSELVQLGVVAVDREELVSGVPNVARGDSHESP